MIPGKILVSHESITLNPGRPVTHIEVCNTGTRAVQVGSHFHFFEANRCLKFDRAAAFGKRLDLPSGSAVRLEPGETRKVDLVPIAGRRIILGFNDLTRGCVDDDSVRETAIATAVEFGYKGAEEKK